MADTLTVEYGYQFIAYFIVRKLKLVFLAKYYITINNNNMLIF